MKYNHIDMLPEGAFQKEFKSMKLHGGGGGSAPPAPLPYDPTKEKDYKEAKKFLDSLKGDIAANNVKMTPEQIVAALSNQQRDIIGQQSKPSVVADMSSWGNFNTNKPIDNISGGYTPQIAPQAGGNFSGVQSVNPQLMSQLQSMLAGSNYLPSTNNTIGGK